MAEMKPMEVWEYHIEKVTMPSDWSTGLQLQEKWNELRDNHLEIMNRLGRDGWKHYQTIGPLFYFKRVKEESLPEDDIPPILIQQEDMADTLHDTIRNAAKRTFG